MKSCPECGSTDIIPDLLVFADEVLSGMHAPYVKLVEPKPVKPPFIWSPKSVATGFRAAVCGACGYTSLYTTHHAELLDAYRKGYTSQTQTQSILPLP
jgi:predicted nucleic-acid-binding Zn-ribbon protein